MTMPLQINGSGSFFARQEKKDRKYLAGTRNSHTFAVYYYTITLMIQLKDITFSYDSKQEVFRDFSLELEKGGIYGLLG